MVSVLATAIGADVRQAPHLVVWAILAGCLWAVANTLTIYAIKDIGLSVAFPLWNANSLLGILWGAVFFNELRGAGWSRVAAVLGGAAVMCAGATLLAVASAAQAPAGHAARGVAAALAAGALWGTMYIPYRKAYLPGMNPLASATGPEHRRWQEAAAREGQRYGIDPAVVRAGLAGESTGGPARRRTWLDWALVTGATAVFVALGLVARVPDLRLGWAWVAGLTLAMLALLGGTGILLWRTTRFN